MAQFNWPLTVSNDGNVWHSHWVVLQPNEQCGKGALGVVDIPMGAKPRLPKTWPGLPILLDSPGWSPTFGSNAVEVRVPFEDIGVVKNMTFDGVTAGLRINQSVHAPLLCVIDVKDIASGDLSLPGKVNEQQALKEYSIHVQLQSEYGYFLLPNTQLTLSKGEAIGYEKQLTTSTVSIQPDPIGYPLVTLHFLRRCRSR